MGYAYDAYGSFGGRIFSKVCNFKYQSSALSCAETDKNACPKTLTAYILLRNSNYSVITSYLKGKIGHTLVQNSAR